MRKFVCLLLMAILPLLSYSQTLQIREFSQQDQDATARTQKKLDNNDNPCALVKVQLAKSGADFDGQVVAVPSYSKSEYYVYMAQGAKKLTVKTNEFLPLEVVFSNYGIKKLEALTTYKLVIEIPNNVAVEEVRTQTGWLIIESNPEGANVYLNEKFVGTTDGALQLNYAYGNYTYRLEKHNYHDLTGELQINESRVHKSLSMVPAFGSISVTSNISGAKVYMDGKDTGKRTPCKLEEVASGSHNLSVRQDNYAPYSENVTVLDGETCSVKANLDAMFSKITIETLNGADIYINGVKRGTSKISEDLVEGFYDVEVRKLHHKPSSRQIEVVAKQTQEISIEPIPIYGSVSITSNPFDAKVSIGGKEYGNTPITIDRLLEGEYDVIISKDGYSSAREHVLVSDGQTSTLSVTLSSGKQVEISTDYIGDVIYIDNIEVGDSPYSGRLLNGQHSVYAMRNDVKSKVVTIGVAEGGEDVINLKLEFPKQQSVKENDAKVVSNAASVYSSSHYELAGKIGNSYEIHMSFDVSGTNCTGSYYYDKYGPSNRMKLSGVFGSGSSTLILNEFNNQGKCTGTFNGTLSANSYSGTYTLEKDGTKMPFKLTTSGTVEDNAQYTQPTNSSSKFVYINATELRLRLSPSLSGDCLKWTDGTNRHPEKGEMFPYLGESGDFYKIDFKGNAVYVSKQFSYIVKSYIMDKVILDYSQIEGLSKEELRVLRNEIYARHGHIFKSQDLREYFNRFNWYSPEVENATNRLTEIEKKNVEFLKEQESYAVSRPLNLSVTVVCLK